MEKSVLLLSVLFLGAFVANATVTFYTDQTVFESLYPGLTTEDYSGTIVPANSVESDLGAFNSTTNNLCFTPGAIVEGISFDNLNSNHNVVLTPPFMGVTSVVIGPNQYADDSEFSFSTPINAFAIDIVMPTASGTIDIEVFGASGSLGTTSSTGDLSGVFWGVYSDVEITSIKFVEQVDNGELFANAQFGVISPSALDNSTWGSIKSVF